MPPRKKLPYLFASSIILALLILGSEGGAVRALKRGTVGALAPLMGVAELLAGLGRGVAGEEALAGELLRALEAEREMLRRENAGLRSALKFKETTGTALRGARVLLFAKELEQEFLLIDQGREAGLGEGDPVVDAAGVLVGSVKEAGDGFSKVAVAANAGEVHEVLLVPLGVRALARSLGARSFSVELIPATVPVRRGDFISLMSRRLGNGASSRGGPGTFRPSLLLGEVVRQETRGGSAFKEVRAVLLARPEYLEEVFIVTNE